MSITGEWYLTAGDTWIAAFLVDDAPGDLPIVVAVTQEPEVAPSSPTPPATVSRIADFPSLLGSDLSTVETVLGRPQDVIPLYPGDMLRYSGSGYAGNYYFGDYFIYGFYDARDVLRGIQIYAGLSDMGFTIDEWHKVLSLVGLPASVRPDEEYLITRRWNNLSVYFVEINSLGPDPSSPIWGIMVWINE